MTKKDSVDLGRWMGKHGVPSRIWVRGNRNVRTLHEIQSSMKKKKLLDKEEYQQMF